MSAMPKSLLLGIVLLSMTAHADAPPGRYSIDTAGTETLADDIVYDTRTMLTWQREMPEGLYEHAAAVAYCVDLELAGGGWRLPKISELRTLLDRTRHTPALDSTAFPASSWHIWWSSTPKAGAPTAAWNADVNVGRPQWGVMTSTLGIRCVR
jgi:hypothetical protein